MIVEVYFKVIACLFAVLGLLSISTAPEHLFRHIRYSVTFAQQKEARKHSPFRVHHQEGQYRSARECGSTRTDAR